MSGLSVPARWWLAVAILCLVGLGVSAYLTATFFTGVGPACGIVPGCREVAESEYSKILGIPVAAVGVIGYSLMLLASLAGVGLERPPIALRLFLGVGAGIAATFSVYLTVIEYAVIHAACVYCLTSACVSWLTLAPVTLAELSIRKAPA